MTAAVDSSELRFRAATSADVAAVVALVESAYRGDISKQGWTTEADFLEGQRTDPVSVGELIERPYSRVLLAERAGTLQCCCHIERQTGEGDARNVGYFGMFAVDPTLQGGGVGKAVLAEAERIASTEWGCSEMQMTVITIRDSLIAWYERRGYARTGVLKPFPYGDERFGIPKREDLQFEILARSI